MVFEILDYYNVETKFYLSQLTSILTHGNMRYPLLKREGLGPTSGGGYFLAPVRIHIKIFGNATWYSGGLPNFQVGYLSIPDFSPGVLL